MDKLSPPQWDTAGWWGGGRLWTSQDGCPKDVCPRGAAGHLGGGQDKASWPAALPPRPPAALASGISAMQSCWARAKLEQYLHRSAVRRDKALLSKRHQAPQCPSCSSGGEGHVGAHRRTTVDKVRLCRFPREVLPGLQDHISSSWQRERQGAAEQKRPCITAWSGFWDLPGARLCF